MATVVSGVIGVVVGIVDVVLGIVDCSGLVGSKTEIGALVVTETEIDGKEVDTREDVVRSDGEPTTASGDSPNN